MKNYFTLIAIFLINICQVIAQINNYCGTLSLTENEIINNFSKELNSQSDSVYIGYSRFFKEQSRNIKATCRGIGNNCYIFVEDSMWGLPGIIVQDEIDDLIQTCDFYTPSNSIDSTKGIFQIEIENFGPIPDEIDNDPKVYILFLDLWCTGYFNQSNQSRTSSISNKIELLYIAADVNNLHETQDSSYYKHIVSHELFHLIDYGQEKFNSYWITEGCAEYASYICGFNEYGVGDSASYRFFHRYDNFSLTTQNDIFYPVAFTFCLYLAEKYGGTSTIKNLISTKERDYNAVNNILLNSGYSDDFLDVIQNWQLAIYLDHYSLQDSMYQYDYIEIPLPLPRNILEAQPFTEFIFDTLPPYSSHQINIQLTSTLQFIFESNFNLRYHKIIEYEDEIFVEELTNISDNNLYYENEDYELITLLVTNNFDYRQPYKYKIDFLSSVNSNLKLINNEFALNQNYPNPFNHSTNISFILPQKSYIKIDIFNISGQLICQLADKVFLSGQHSLKWNGKDKNNNLVNSGIYYYRIENGNQIISKKMILIR